MEKAIEKAMAGNEDYNVEYRVIYPDGTTHWVFAKGRVTDRIDDNLDIPEPSDTLENEYLVPVPMQTALKAAVTLAMSESQMNQVQLANALKVNEKEVRRIFDSHHGTKLGILARTLNILGKKAVLSVWSH